MKQEVRLNGDGMPGECVFSSILGSKTVILVPAEGKTSESEHKTEPNALFWVVFSQMSSATWILVWSDKFRTLVPVFGPPYLRKGGLEEVKREVNRGDVVLFQGFCSVLARYLD